MLTAGVYAPLLTAFGTSGAVDQKATAAHAQWLAERGVTGVVPFGTSGEGPSLSVREKLATLGALIAALPGTRVVPAVAENSLDSALELVATINDMPVAGVLVLPPYYFRPPVDLARYLRAVVEASRHPVLLYHIPELAPAIPVELVADLPVWGVKDSGGDLAYTRAVLAASRGVFVGAETTIVEAVTAGASGTIAGFANVLPEHLLAAVASARAGNPADAAARLAPALKVRAELLRHAGPLEWIGLLKALAEHRHGIPMGGVRPPVPQAAAAVAAALAPMVDAALRQLPPAN